MKQKIFFLNPLTMLFSGLLLGIMARIFDMYLQNLGEIFSQMSIWILLGTLISIYSSAKKAAMLNIFLFCLGMLLTYYAATIFAAGVYEWSFIIGWTVFALFFTANGLFYLDDQTAGNISQNYRFGDCTFSDFG